MYEYFCIFLYFIIYSFIGYIVEVIAISLNYNKLILSRGYLIGPIIPVFGVGVLSILYLLDKYSNDLITAFVLAVVLCSVIEYTTSYLMEKIFKLRWWDYYDKKFNVNGRIALDYAVYFGLAGVFILKVFHPFLSKVIHSIDPLVIIVISTIFAFLFIIDFIVSTEIIFSFKKNINKLVKRDSTMKIKREVRSVLKTRSPLLIRLIKAFPNIVSNRDFKKSRIYRLILDRPTKLFIKRIRKDKK